MEELASQQSIIGKDIERMLINFKKDSRSRKTTDYLQRKYDALEELWTKFEDNHLALEALKTTEPDHPYFTKQFYQDVSNLRDQLRELIVELQQSTSQTQNPSDDKEPIDQTVKISAPTLSDENQLFNIQPGPNLQANSTAPVVDKSVEKAINRQHAIMRTITHFLQDINSKLDTNHSVSYYVTKSALLQNYAVQMRETNHLIWELTTEKAPYGYSEDYYLELEDWLQDTIIALEEKFQDLRSNTRPNNASQSNLAATSTSFKLPKITLPTFNGHYLKWVQFRELYLQLIHRQPISNAQKMYYLVNNLSGDPYNLIKHLPITDENYDSAWGILCSRYDNNRLLVTAILNQFLLQPILQTESAAGIKALHDTTKECLLGLKNLGINIDSWDPIVVHLVIRKFDRSTHALYEQSLKSPKELNSIENVLNFLETRFQSLEALGRKGISKDQPHQKAPVKTSTFTAVTSQREQCIICQQTHPLFTCKIFLSKTPMERYQLLRKHNLCVNCMRKGHMAATCTLRSCTKCSRKHNTLVHPAQATPKPIDKSDHSSRSQLSNNNHTSCHVTQPIAAQEVSADPVTTTASLTAQSSQGQRKYIVLGTARVKVTTHQGREVECRAILDSGSQLSFITQGLANKLHLREIQDPLIIKGIGQTTKHSNKKLNIVLKSRTTGYVTNIQAHILPKITANQPSTNIDITNWKIPQNLELADPTFHTPQPVDMLIGAETYYDLLSIGQVKLGRDQPILQNTVLGWVVAGRINEVAIPREITCGICSYEEGRLEDQVEQFWKLEEVEDTKPTLTLVEKRCENHFNQNTQRNECGRFVVKLPFSDDVSKLGESKNIAMARLRSMERKFRKDPDLKLQYVAFMKEYQELGHMESVQLDKVPSSHYFLPHHCVLKPDSSTTKLRVVFDASAKTSTNKSLNDILHTGPKIQDELFSILLRFRLPRFVFTADIEKMYRQIQVDPSDRRFQLILWREHEDQPVQYFQLKTVTYGVTTAPYLAIKCLRRLAEQEQHRFPLGATCVQQNLYVDDAMVGANSLQEALEKQSQLDKMLRTGGFKLRKWCANHPRLLEHIPLKDRALQVEFHNTNGCNIKTLGLIWTPKTDDFRITSINSKDDQRVTKRTVLSDIAHLFDPLGIMSPVVIIAKLILKELWSLKLDWDAAVPMEIHTQWVHFRKSLEALNNITVPRHIAAGRQVVSMQLHAFSDASEKAYGCAIYVRSILPDGVILVRLLCAKSRVAPSSKITLPRLELCAAKLAAQLLNRVKAALNWNQPSFCWTDSTIVLAWLNAASSSYHTFVANRIASIQELTTPEQWNHVPSKSNPADIVSRGISPTKLQECTLWFYGPIFLHAPESAWPSKPINLTTDLESKTTRTALTGVINSTCIIDQINHRNSFYFLQRVIGYMVRYIRNYGNGQRPRIQSNLVPEPLKPTELEDALIIIIKEVQLQGFPADIQRLKKGEVLNVKSPLNSLSPFLDSRGLVRVGGRLTEANLPYDARHPMLLPYAHDITRMILNHIHVNNAHAGPQALLAIARQRFWPIKGKTTARSIVQNCVRCQRSKPQMLSQFMGSLPASRVQPARPFINSGVDFCGPFWTHFKIRGKRPVKAYVAIFCCFATKAVHIEVVSDLTTDAFIGALKRFISRRGNCKNLYCDNATNFIGAKNRLKELEDAIFSNPAQERISNTCSVKGIEFHLIPPRAPHFGGLWEAAVKSAKTLFYKSVVASSLTYEELETVMVEIEAILNSRPLTPMSSDPNDLTALTPGHLLIGEPLTSIVDPHAQPMKGNLTYRWKLISQLKNDFWIRWVNEYLSELQHRYKWRERQDNVKPGTMVILKEDNTPPLSWPLGRIVNTIPGNDGIVRVADVKTASGILRRPIHKLAPLPVESDPEITPGDTQPDINSHPSSFKRPSTSSQEDIESQHSTESSEPTKKRNRRAMPAAAACLMTCLLMPFAATSEVIVTPFSTPPGLYFENLGTTYLSSNEWSIVAFFNLTSYWTELHTICNNTDRLTKMCTSMRNEQLCLGTVSQLWTIIGEIHNSNELLTPTHLRRTKRAPLDIIGTLANSLFGVLDATYAERMSGVISNLEDNQDHLLELLKNQTSIIDSTTNIIKKSHQEAEKLSLEFEEYVNKTMHIIHGVQLELREQRITEMFNALSIRLTLQITNFQRIQSALLNVLIDTHHGKVNPLLLSPKQLWSQVQLIRDNLPSTLRLPAEKTSLLELYNLLEIQGRTTPTQVIFRLRVPLLSHETFQLMSVIPVPAAVNNTFITIEPSAQYIIVNLHQDLYYPLTRQELDKCFIIQQTTHLCKQHHPLYQSVFKKTACEINILKQVPIPSSCKISSSADAPRWTQLNNPNEWLYTVKQKTLIHIYCGITASQKYIEGSGIVNISRNCVIKDDATTIQGHNLYSSALYTAITPSKNFVEHIPPPQLTTLVRTALSPHHVTHDISELKESLNRLKMAEATSIKGQHHHTHYSSVGYSSLSIIILILCYLSWRRYKDHSVATQPIPAPRTRPEDFELRTIPRSVDQTS